MGVSDVDFKIDDLKVKVLQNGFKTFQTCAIYIYVYIYA